MWKWPHLKSWSLIWTILGYWYNMETFICSCGQRSQIKVKGHLRSTCKITWKSKFGLICILQDQLELSSQVWGSRSDVNLHHPQTATAGVTSSLGTVKYFFLEKKGHCIHILWSFFMGHRYNDPWVDSHMWPQQKWGQRSSWCYWVSLNCLSKSGFEK